MQKLLFESIGHAITTDFVHWDRQTPVLSPGTWDDKALWAPFLLKVNNTWHMFFTGVNQAISQQSGVAFSGDLYDWFKLSWPIYRPSSSWAEWTETGFAHGRDPHVIQYNGKYYMYVTAKTFTNEGAVGLAESSDLINWTDIGPAYVHNTWHVLESVHVKEHGGKWHMLFTEEAVNGTSHITSSASPLTSILNSFSKIERKFCGIYNSIQENPRVRHVEDVMKEFIILLP